MKITVIGAGSWGTCLAWLLADRGFPVTLWAYETEIVEQIRFDRQNRLYLPGVLLPETLTATTALDEAAQGADVLVFVVPSHVARPILTRLAPILAAVAGGPLPMIVSATKGIEVETGHLMTEVMTEVLPEAVHPRLAVLSGPSFAKEVCQRLPTAVVIASRDADIAESLQHLCATSFFRVYRSTDVIGAQLGGALKNVMALAAGGADGLGLGHNTRAALIARGLAEMVRLGVAMGADAQTFAGLSGLGDLVLTCTGELSRNRTVGYQIGQGRKLAEILQGMKAVAEGVNTTKSAFLLAKRHGVEMPIVERLHAVLFDGKDPRQAVVELMTMPSGDERETRPS